jgi:hypothetical protein
MFSVICVECVHQPLFVEKIQLIIIFASVLPVHTTIRSSTLSLFSDTTNNRTLALVEEKSYIKLSFPSLLKLNFRENMYGGLFGDLPATKQKSSTATSASSVDDTTQGRKGDAAAGAKESTRDPKSEHQDAQAPPPSSSKINIPKPSFVPRMFIPPQASRPRSKPQQPTQAPPQLALSQAGKKRPAHTVSTTHTSVALPLHPTEAKKMVSNTTSSTTPTEDTHMVENNMTTDVNVISHKEVVPQTPSSAPKLSRKPYETDTLDNDREASCTAQSTINDSNNNNNQNLYYPESDVLTDLHEQAKQDPYDPFVPNDLLAYWERKAVEQQRQKLFRERQQALEAQEQLRLRLEQERQQILASGNIDRIVEFQQQQQYSVPWNDNSSSSSSSSGVGRGRGAAKNLPAWLVEKQRKEREQLPSEPSKKIDNE